MDLTARIFGISLGSPSPAVVALALFFAVLTFAFAEHLAETKDDPRILISTLVGMASFVWLVEVTPGDGRPSFTVFLIEVVMGCGAFGASSAVVLLVLRTFTAARSTKSRRSRSGWMSVFAWCATRLVTMVRRAWPRELPN